jgi:hypothetical protein
MWIESGIRSVVLAEYRARFGPDFPQSSFSRIAVEKHTRERFRAFAELQYGIKAPDFSRPAGVQYSDKAPGSH